MIHSSIVLLGHGLSGALQIIQVTGLDHMQNKLTCNNNMSLPHPVFVMSHALLCTKITVYIQAAQISVVF